MSTDREDISHQAGRPLSVLFVCTANRCRSPMAEGFFRDYVTQKGTASDWSIASAGTWAMEGIPPMPSTVAVMEEWGIDVGGYRSSHIDAKMLQEYNLILVMKKGHKESVCLEFPEVSERVFLISEMAGYGYEIEDPVAGTIVDYRNTANELRILIEQGADRIRDLAGRVVQSER